MFISKSKTFYDAIKPFVYLNCFVGIGAFRLPDQSNSAYVFMTLYTFVMTLITWTTTYFISAMLIDFKSINNVSSMSFTMRKVIFCGNSCFAGIVPFFVWLQRKGLKGCLQQMLILDNTFESVFGIRNDYRKEYIRLTSRVIGMILVMICVLIIDNSQTVKIVSQLDTRSTFMFCIAKYLEHHPILVLLLLDVNFCTFVGYNKKLTYSLCLKIYVLDPLEWRFIHVYHTLYTYRYLNKKIRYVNDSLLRLRGERLFVVSENVVKTKFGCRVENAEIEKHYLLREIRKAHLELCKLSRKINRVFGIQNLLSTGVSFGMITGLLYTIYSAFSWENFTTNKLIDVIGSTIWTTIYALKIFMVNHSCESISSEAKRTGDVIYELLEPKVEKDFQTEIQEFGVQMLQNPIRFNACGFFTLDHTFVQGVIGSITTYLVILIQMSHVSTNPTSNTTLIWNDTSISPN